MRHVVETNKKNTTATANNEFTNTYLVVSAHIVRVHRIVCVCM